MTSAYSRALPKFADKLDASPIVAKEHLKAHLLCLSAFNEILNVIDGGEPKFDLGTRRRTASDAMQVFLQRAVQRLQIWIEKVLRKPGRTIASKSPLLPEEIPPLDVLMVLFAYMLRPLRFWEDCLRLFPELHSIDGFPLFGTVNLINSGTLAYTPTAAQRSHWETRTGISFDPSSVTSSTETTIITCPFCLSTILVPWVGAGRALGKGYGEHHFEQACGSCSNVITQDNLSFGKLFADLKTAANKNDFVLAGSLLDVQGNPDVATARRLTLEIYRALDVGNANSSSRYNWSYKRARNHLNNLSDLAIRKEMLEHLLAPYTQGTVFSTDLTISVLGLSFFTATMIGYGWLTKDFLQNDIQSKVLEDAIPKYHRFLELALEPELDRLAPTPDIDLVWHTHQVLGSVYREQTAQLVGSILDHVAVSTPDFVESFSDTASQWMGSYGSGYSRDEFDTRPLKPMRDIPHKYVPPEHGGHRPVGCTSCVQGITQPHHKKHQWFVGDV